MDDWLVFAGQAGESDVRGNDVMLHAGNAKRVYSQIASKRVHML